MLNIFKYNFFKVIFSEFIFRVLGFLTSIYVARIISVDGVGIIGMTNSILIYGTILSSPGFHIFGIKNISQNDNFENMKKIIYLRFIFSLFVTILLFFSISFFNFFNNYFSIFFISTLTIIPFTMQNEWYLQSKKEINFINLGKLLFSIIQLILILTFLKSKNDLIVVVLVLFASNVFLFLFQFLKIPTNFSKKNSSSLTYFEIIKKSLPIGLSSSQLIIVQNLPILFLGFFSTLSETGFYTTSFRIILTFLMVDRFLFIVVFPRIAEESKKNISKLSFKIQSILNLIFLYSIIIFSIVLLFGNNIIESIWGIEFSKTIYSLIFLIPYMSATIYNSIFGAILISIDNELFYSKVVLNYTFISLISVLVLTFYFGSIGGAIAISISECFMAFRFFSKIKLLMNIKFINSLNFINDFKQTLKYF